MVRLKGPLVPLVQGMTVLAALDCFDRAVSFGDNTPAALVVDVGPDGLANGGCYEPAEIACHAGVVERGGADG